MNAQHGTKQLLLKPVVDRSTLRDFLKLPSQLYADDPRWVPPLFFERRQALSPKNPFFEHATWQAWVAYDGLTPVGRVSAQIDDLYEQQHGERVGYFGMLEASNDPAVFKALFQKAEGWLRERDAIRAVGPFNLGINQELGILIEGFETPPYFMMPHGRPYYDSAITDAGYLPVRDLLAYLIVPDFERPPVMRGLLKRMQPEVELRRLDRKNVDAELEILRDIFNDAWSGNWGFVPFTEAEFNGIGREMLLLIPDDFIQIAELKGSPAAFIVLLHMLTEAIAVLSGRLLPFGWS